MTNVHLVTFEPMLIFDHMVNELMTNTDHMTNDPMTILDHMLVLYLMW